MVNYIGMKMLMKMRRNNDNDGSFSWTSNRRIMTSFLLINGSNKRKKLKFLFSKDNYL